MVNLTKLEAELKKITVDIISISAKVNQKWAPQGEHSIFVDAEGDSVGLSYSTKLDGFVLSQIEQAVLSHSKEDTNEQKLIKAAETMPNSITAALVSVVDSLSKSEKPKEWAIDLISKQAALLPGVDNNINPIGG